MPIMCAVLHLPCFDARRAKQRQLAPGDGQGVLMVVMAVEVVMAVVHHRAQLQVVVMPMMLPLEQQ